MSPVITVALPVFAIIAAGFAAARFNVLGADDIQSLNKFVFRLAMPVALFALAATTPAPGGDDLIFAFCYGAAGLAVILGGYFLSKSLFGLTGPEAGAHGFSCTLGNAVFLGLPIAINIDGWSTPFVVLMLIEGTIIIALGALLMAPRDGASGFVSGLTGALKNPLVIGMAAGLAYSISGLPLGGPTETFLTYLGRAAGPTALISLGLFLGTHQFPAIAQIGGRVSAIVLAKMILLPSLAFALALTLGVSDPAYLGALALFTLVPTGVGAYVMASQYGVYTSESAAAVLTTTLLSVLTISGVLIYFA